MPYHFISWLSSLHLEHIPARFTVLLEEDRCNASWVVKIVSKNVYSINETFSWNFILIIISSSHQRLNISFFFWYLRACDGKRLTEKNSWITVLLKDQCGFWVCPFVYMCVPSLQSPCTSPRCWTIDKSGNVSVFYVFTFFHTTTFLLRRDRISNKKGRENKKMFQTIPLWCFWGVNEKEMTKIYFGENARFFLCYVLIFILRSLFGIFLLILSHTSSQISQLRCF